MLAAFALVAPLIAAAPVPSISELAQRLAAVEAALAALLGRSSWVNASSSTVVVGGGGGGPYGAGDDDELDRSTVSSLEQLDAEVDELDT